MPLGREELLGKRVAVEGLSWEFADLGFVAFDGHFELPNIGAWYERLSERPAYREHAMIPFGRNPAEWYLLEREPAS